MVGYSPAVPGRLEHQTELVADPGLALELRQGAGPERRFGGTLLRIGVGTHQPGEVVVAHMTHRKPLLASQALQRGPHQDCDIDQRILTRQVLHLIARGFGVPG